MGGADVDVLAKIEKLRVKRGFTMAELARAAGLKPSTLHGLYRRNNLPTIPTLEAICSAFGITIAQFFADSDVPPDLTSQQRSFLEHLNPLTVEQKTNLLALIKCM